MLRNDHSNGLEIILSSKHSEMDEPASDMNESQFHNQISPSKGIVPLHCRLSRINSLNYLVTSTSTNNLCHLPRGGKFCSVVVQTRSIDQQPPKENSNNNNNKTAEKTTNKKTEREEKNRRTEKSIETLRDHIAILSPIHRPYNLRCFVAEMTIKPQLSTCIEYLMIFFSTILRAKVKLISPTFSIYHFCKVFSP